MKKGFTIPVLDHGFVRYVDHMGTDKRICEAARISYRAPSKGKEADKKLLAYLWKNKHTSPFEMVKLTLNIKMPIFVMRQYVRHRMQNLNEVSARYTELPAEFYIPRKWRMQDTQNKQGSVTNDNWRPMVKLFPEEAGQVGLPPRVDATGYINGVSLAAYEAYQNLLEAGVAREMARMVLPLNIYTEIYACWDLKNLLHFITLRDDSHAQAEIQDYGKAIGQIVAAKFPWTWEVYKKYKWKLVEE